MISWFSSGANGNPASGNSPPSGGSNSGSSSSSGSSNGRRCAANKPDPFAVVRAELLNGRSHRTQEPLGNKSITPAAAIPGQARGQEVRLQVAKLQSDWKCDYNLVYINPEVPLSSGYAQLQVEGRSGSFMVKVVKLPDAQPGCVHIAQTPRANFELHANESSANRVTLTPCKQPPARCWDSVSLTINLVLELSNRRCESKQITKSESDIGSEFLKQFRASGCILTDGHSYSFDDGTHLYVSQVRLQSSDQVKREAGLLTEDASVVSIGLSRKVAGLVVFSGAAPTIDRRKLSARFEFNGERYGIGGLDKNIRQFVNEFVAPRLLPGALQEKMRFSVSRGGILSGPPGTGKTLFISVLESLLKDNGFNVNVKIVSGPEVFDPYMGKSEANVRDIFADSGSDSKAVSLILIDEIDSMLPCRGSMSDSTGAGSKVVNQFLTCLDGIEKKNNLVVFGTTNRPDLIDPAVMRPGRMNMKMQFSLPDKTQRRQILGIQVKELRDCGMLHCGIDLDQLTANTAGFTGAELAALVDSARVFALQRAQGLGKDDMYFSPQAISNLESFELNAGDFQSALRKIQPQFGKSDFMPLAGKSYETGNYPVDTINRLKIALKNFRQDRNSSVLRILIQGPAGSGKSTLSALVQQDFGSFCSYVSAMEVVKSRDRRLPLVDAFSQRTHQQPDQHYCVVIDDFDTMINFDGVNYNHDLVSMLDAYTKQKLHSGEESKQLVVVTATEYEGTYAPVQFLPTLFSKEAVFRTRMSY